MTERGCWVYGVTDRQPARDLSWPPGVAGGAVRTAATPGGLVALVSDVDLDEFGEEALARNLEDLDWLERVARAHHHVIESASRALPLLPVSLATVYTSEPGMTAALGARRRDFLDALALVRDRVEWGVKAYARPERTEPGRDAPRPSRDAPGRDAAGGGEAGGGSGLAYLRRRREQLSARQDSRRDAAEAARDVHAALEARAARARLHPPQSARLSGADTPMLLNAAYLLDRGDEAGFRAAVTAAADSHPELRVELTGPWPPYSFAGGDRRGAA